MKSPSSGKWRGGGCRAISAGSIARAEERTLRYHWSGGEKGLSFLASFEGSIFRTGETINMPPSIRP